MVLVEANKYNTQPCEDTDCCSDWKIIRKQGWREKTALPTSPQINEGNEENEIKRNEWMHNTSTTI